MTNDLTVINNQDLIIFDDDKIGLIKRTVAKDATDDELALFLHQCKRTGLDPLAKQIYFQKYNTKNGPQIAIITGIDGYRLVAARTGVYAGNDAPEFDGRQKYSGVDVPAKATVKVWRLVSGKRVPFAASVYWDEYVPNPPKDYQWKKMPHVMLAKCAEAAALRKAFPADLSGVYTNEEMQQADWTDIDTETGEIVTTPKASSSNGRKTRVIDIPEVISPDEVKLTARDDHEQHVSPGDQPPNNLAAFAVWYAARDGSYATNVDVVKKLTAEFGKDVGGNFTKRGADEYIGVLSGKPGVNKSTYPGMVNAFPVGDGNGMAHAFPIGAAVTVKDGHNVKAGTIRGHGGDFITVTVNGKDFNLSPDKVTIVDAEPVQDDLFTKDTTYDA